MRSRWLYHLTTEVQTPDRHAPASLEREGFVHCSFRDAVAGSARAHFTPEATLFVWRIDPRRVGAPIDVVATPRGPMPHVRGPIPRDAVVAVVPLSGFDAAPDAVTATRFGFVAFRGMTLLDLVGAYDPISRIGSMGLDETASFEIVAAHEGAAWEAHGARLLAVRVRPSLDAFDVLVVPGGLAARELAHDAAVVPWLRTFPESRLAVSVCTGALLLGAAGRLSGLRATTHASALDELARYGATAVRQRVVDEGAVITAAGVTSGLDAGLHVVAELCGIGARDRVARQMEYAPAP